MLNGAVEDTNSGVIQGLGIRIYNQHEAIYAYTNQLEEETVIKAIMDLAHSKDKKQTHFAKERHQGYSLRMLIDGKLGYAFCEMTQKEGLLTLVQCCIENTKSIDATSDVQFVSPQEYTTVNTYTEQLARVSFQEKRDTLLELERRLLTNDERIVKVTCNYSDTVRCVELCNTNGLDVSSKSNYATLLIHIVAKENEQAVVDYDVQVLSEFKKEDILADVERVVTTVLNKLNPTRVPSGSYPCIIENKAFATLLQTMSGIFSQDNVNKDLSLLKDKLSKPVFSNKLTLIDNPHLEHGILSCAFDHEGNATKVKSVVKEGILNCFINDQKSAQEANTQVTGNGFKGSYNSKVSATMTNLYVQEGTTTVEDMIKNMDEGVLINSFAGLHAGVNPLITDFSLQSSGFYVKEGKIVKAISLITIAGNFIDLLKNIDAVGDDLKFYTNIGSPSILFKAIAVSGE